MSQRVRLFDIPVTMTDDEVMDRFAALDLKVIEISNRQTRGKIKTMHLRFSSVDESQKAVDLKKLDWNGWKVLIKPFTDRNQLKVNHSNEIDKEICNITTDVKEIHIGDPSVVLKAGEAMTLPATSKSTHSNLSGQKISLPTTSTAAETALIAKSVAASINNIGENRQKAVDNIKEGKAVPITSDVKVFANDSASQRLKNILISDRSTHVAAGASASRDPSHGPTMKIGNKKTIQSQEKPNFQNSSGHKEKAQVTTNQNDSKTPSNSADFPSHSRDKLSFQESFETSFLFNLDGFRFEEVDDASLSILAKPFQQLVENLSKLLQSLFPVRIHSSHVNWDDYKLTLNQIKSHLLSQSPPLVQGCLIDASQRFLSELFDASCRYLSSHDMEKLRLINISFDKRFQHLSLPSSIAIICPNDSAKNRLNGLFQLRFPLDLQERINTHLKSQIAPYPPETIERVRFNIEQTLSTGSLRGRVLVFGSLRSGIYTAGSDLDLILCTKEFDNQYHQCYSLSQQHELNQCNDQLKQVQIQQFHHRQMLQIIQKMLTKYPLIIDLEAIRTNALSKSQLQYIFRHLLSHLIHSLQGRLQIVEENVFSLFSQLKELNLIMKNHLQLIRSTKNNRKCMYQLSSILERRGCDVIELRARARVPVCKILELSMNLPCDIVMNYKLGMYNSDLIQCYVQMDPSQKVFRFLLFLKIFMKSRNMCDASKGYPSSYTWILLGLHVLIHHGFLPSTLLLYQGRSFCEGFDVSYDHEGYSTGLRHDLPRSCQYLLSQVSLIELFYLFCEYLLQVSVDDILTLRMDGIVLTKTDMETLSPLSIKQLANSSKAASEISKSKGKTTETKEISQQTQATDSEDKEKIPNDDNDLDDEDNDEEEDDEEEEDENDQENVDNDDVRDTMIDTTIFQYGKRNVWRIEDPFESIHSINPRNLGLTIKEQEFKKILTCLQYSRDVLYDLQIQEHTSEIRSMNEQDKEISGHMDSQIDKKDGGDSSKITIESFMKLFDPKFEFEQNKKKRRKPRNRSRKSANKEK